MTKFKRANNFHVQLVDNRLNFKIVRMQLCRVFECQLHVSYAIHCWLLGYIENALTIFVKSNVTVAFFIKEKNYATYIDRLAGDLKINTRVQIMKHAYNRMCSRRS